MAVIEYLREENRVLREQLGTRRLRFKDDQRCRLASKAKLVGRRLLNDTRNRGQHFKDAWDRTSARTDPENHVEGVPQPTLGTNCSR